MGVHAFEFDNGNWTDKTKQLFPENLNGLWFSLTVSDLDKDGYEDLILGNIGSNTQLKFTGSQPLDLYYADFDQNGSIDPFLNFYIQGVSYPFVSRDELNDQMYSMRRKFSSYKDYSTATMKDIFSVDDLAKAAKKTATENQTIVLMNKKGRFEKQVLPAPAQFSIVTNILAEDFNKDGHTDLLLLGNKSDNRLKIGSIEANYGCLLAGDGKGGFHYITQDLSGLKLKGDCKSAIVFKQEGQSSIVIGLTGQPLQLLNY
jgi:hypothetical protein